MTCGRILATVRAAVRFGRLDGITGWCVAIGLLCGQAAAAQTAPAQTTGAQTPAAQTAAAQTAAAQSASAQTAPASTSPPLEFLPRYAFHMTADHLSSDDERFVWDANFGGSVDLLDYGQGRATFIANYEAILGEEFRRFDVNQGNYLLRGEVSRRVRRVEVAAVFHHISRHLSDRPKRQAVDWNMLGAHVTTGMSHGRLDLEARGDVRGVLKKSFVDYRWELETDVRVQYHLGRVIAAFGGGGLRILGTDGSLDRGTQTGGRGEAGVRITGRGGSAELVVAVERRIDPYPLEFGTTRWVSAGFRFLSPP